MLKDQQIKSLMNDKNQQIKLLMNDKIYLELLYYPLMISLVKL